jgi:hypothetical protein
MRRLFVRGRRHVLPRWQRIDRAAAQMNPYLVIIAIGLALLNLICLLRPIPPLDIASRLPYRATVLPPASSVAPALDAALRAGT